MTDTIRDLLISLSSHMAYMQGQLEARHELDDFEDFYWYRESVLLRQKVTDALADEPAVPEGREPAAVAGQPSDEELLALVSQGSESDFCLPRGLPSDWVDGDFIAPPEAVVAFARAVLARYGHQPAPVAGEVAELVDRLRRASDGASAMGWEQDSWAIARAAELLHRLSPPQPVPVSERLPGPEDCDAEGRCWLFSKVEKEWRLMDAGNPGVPHLKYCFSHWLPAHALPIPHQQEDHQ